MNFNERQIIQQAEYQFDGWTEEDGLTYLDTSLPSEYEPEPIIADLGTEDLKPEEFSVPMPGDPDFDIDIIPVFE